MQKFTLEAIGEIGFGVEIGILDYSYDLEDFDEATIEKEEQQAPERARRQRTESGDSYGSIADSLHEQTVGAAKQVQAQIGIGAPATKSLIDNEKKVREIMKDNVHPFMYAFDIAQHICEKRFLDPLWKMKRYLGSIKVIKDY